MDSWLKKSHDSGNQPPADDFAAAVKTNANRVFASCIHWVPVSGVFRGEGMVPRPPFGVPVMHK